MRWLKFTRRAEGVFEFTSAAPGPRVTLVGGIHGNERIGVLVLDALRLALLGAAPLPLPLASTDSQNTAISKRPPAVELSLERGALTLVYGNPAALRLGTRGSSPHADLNRCFGVDVLSTDHHTHADDGYEQRRARELASILAASDVMLDLHSTNAPAPPFVRVAGGGAAVPAALVRLAARLPCDIMVHDPQFLLGGGRVALTDEFVGAHGGLGLCFESGLASDLSDANVRAILHGVLHVLQFDTQSIAPVLPREDAAARADRAMTTFTVTQAFRLSDRGFQWADGVGARNFQRVAARAPIGFVGGEPFAVDYDAHVVFPKIPSLWKVGSYVLTQIAL
ncbi:hypothetical protein PybrP1_004154 [[Pythium] brassicae (nom. inval.)]|nr:hypothetical protein PybrP1_004154 [[Pythium] brassicae (nom. inval.)]